VSITGHEMEGSMNRSRLRIAAVSLVGIIATAFALAFTRKPVAFIAAGPPLPSPPDGGGFVFGAGPGSTLTYVYGAPSSDGGTIPWFAPGGPHVTVCAAA